MSVKNFFFKEYHYLKKYQTYFKNFDRPQNFIPTHRSYLECIIIRLILVSNHLDQFIYL